MAPNADPWRTLGLAPGATQDEIRRAYRRLAKLNHPDAGGDAALPRFLAIQAAYEQLAGPGGVRRVGARPASRPTDGAPADAREPWRADPARARASGRADGRRTPGARPSGPGARARAAPGATPPGTGTNPGGARGTGNPGTSGSADGASADPTGGAHRSRRSSRRRPANRATPGSTSYEGADQEPFEPGWSGATWYGASSGTYWTINPKEYADPRKHGPEYQARARRAREGWILDGPEGTAAGGDERPEPTAEPAARQATDARTAPPDASDPGPAPAAGRGRGDQNGPADSAPPAADTAASRDGFPPRSFRARRASGPGVAAGPAGASRRADARAAASATGADHSIRGPAGAASAAPGPTPGDPGRPRPRFGAGESPRAGLAPWIDQPSGGPGFRGPLLRRPTTALGRLAMAVLGWPPLGVFAAAAIDETTGCGRLAASCPEISSPGTWIVQAAILLLLLALPVVAAWSAHGAVAALIVGVPSAVVLSAAGGSNVRDQSGPLLLAVLAIAYLGGVLYAVIVARGRSSPA
jgi:curved DNA-binding protein CbpA